MRTLTIEPEQWAPWLERQRENLRWARATLEVLDPERKRFVEADGVLLETVRLDEADLVVDGPKVSHRVVSLSALSVVEDTLTRPLAIEATDGQGVRHVLRIVPARAIA